MVQIFLINSFYVTQINLMQSKTISCAFMMFSMCFDERINQFRSCELHARWNCTLECFLVKQLSKSNTWLMKWALRADSTWQKDACFDWVSL